MDVNVKRASQHFEEYTLWQSNEAINDHVFIGVVEESASDEVADRLENTLVGPHLQIRSDFLVVFMHFFTESELV
jgi:hypothetical protein